MRWLAEWRALAVRIEGLCRAADAFMTSMAVQATDNFNLGMRLFAPTGQKILNDLTLFLEAHRTAMPAEAAQAVQSFVTTPSRFSLDNANAWHANLQSTISLRVLVSEVEYLLSDTEAAAKSRVDQAFLHLRRALVVDDTLRGRWIAALEDKGEPGCEKLGALHMLSHGIFAFKAGGAGAATDLILGGPANDADASVASSAVLTEWKVAKSSADATVKAREAVHQATAYAGGLLAGLEMRSHRYVVIVSRSTVEIPGNRIEDRITYHHIGLFLDGLSPSVAARRPTVRR
jgi:hypothetical protein